MSVQLAIVHPDTSIVTIPDSLNIKDVLTTLDMSQVETAAIPRRLQPKNILDMSVIVDTFHPIPLKTRNKLHPLNIPLMLVELKFGWSYAFTVERLWSEDPSLTLLLAMVVVGPH